MTWTLYGAHGRDEEIDGPMVMAILNATPDSFSDGGMLETDLDARLDALARADIFDIGGESTRPGHEPVSAAEEIRRVVPVVEAVRARFPEAWISIDTQKTAVARAALDAGADFLNDVSGMREPGMGRLASDRACSIVLMRHEDCFGDIVGAARDQLRALLVRAKASGIAEDQVILDPGLGFGERPGASVEENLALVDHVRDYALGRPVLIGASRKRFIGAATGIEDPLQRDVESAAIARRAVDAGAAIARVHDVEATLEALQ